METAPYVFFVLILIFPLSWEATSSSTYDTFVQCLSAHLNSSHQISSIIYSPTNPSYPTVLNSYVKNRRFNRSTSPKPVLIVAPLLDTQVSATVLCAKSAGIQLKIRSGGHDYEGISYVSAVPFIILDTFNLRSITIDTEDMTAWVQAGATLGELYHKIAAASKVHGFPGGICLTLGVGGHISGGGYGNMLRAHGLSSDNVLDAQIVDVNGRILDRKGMGEDLFWAIRGGGGASFGVLLSYKIRLVQVSETVTVFRVERSLEENATDIVWKWQNIAATMNENVFIRLLLAPVKSKQTGKMTIRASFMSLSLVDAQLLLKWMDKEFPELGLTRADCMEMSWIQSVLYWAGFDNGTSVDALLSRTSNSTDRVKFLKRKSDYVRTPIPRDGLESIWKKLIKLGGKIGLVFNPYGGRMNEIPAADTAFPHRAGNLFKIQYSVNWDDEAIGVENNFVKQMRQLYNFMTPFVSKNPRAAFLNYRDLDIGTTDNGKDTYKQGKVYGTKYFTGNFDRLVKVKTAVDPQNFFRNEQSIPPLPS